MVTRSIREEGGALPGIDTGFLTRRMPDPEGRLYTVFVPNDYDPEIAWPVTLFLHGAGEGGTDGLLPTEYQLGSAIRRSAEAFPGLVVFPQCRAPQYVWSSSDVAYAMSVLAQVVTDFTIDPHRMYLTGVSTGAKACWHALYRHPTAFAAALVVAGVVRPRLASGSLVPDPDPVVPEAHADPAAELAASLRDTPVWIFHGTDDPVFPVSDARKVVAALESVGAPVRYSEFEGFGHDVWDIAFYSPEVIAWLYDQRRSTPS